MNYIPGVIRRIELARVLWKNFGISYTEMLKMDAQECRMIEFILSIEQEVGGGRAPGGCPLLGG